MSTQSVWQSWVRSPSHGASTFHIEPGCCLCSFRPEVSWGSRGQSPFCREAVPAAIPSQPLRERAVQHSPRLPLTARRVHFWCPRGCGLSLCSLKVCAVGRTHPPVLVRTAGQVGQETAFPGRGLSTQCSVEPSRSQRLLLPFLTNLELLKTNKSSGRRNALCHHRCSHLRGHAASQRPS